MYMFIATFFLLTQNLFVSVGLRTKFNSIYTPFFRTSYFQVIKYFDSWSPSILV